MRKLNLGCGSTWKEKYPDYEGLDIVDYGQKYVTSILNGLVVYSGDKEKDLLAGEFEEVMANHFLEHFSQDELKHIFLMVHDLLRPGGIFKIVVPHKDRPESWYLVHKTFFNEQTFLMFDRTETDSYAEFGKWKVKSVIVNSRMDIHCQLEKI